MADSWKRQTMILAFSGALAAGFAFRNINFSGADDVVTPPQRETPSELLSAKTTVHVPVVHPLTGGLARTTTLPATVESFQFADLFAKVSGYLTHQQVDIGDIVHRGQVVAEIYVPELHEELKQAESSLAQAQAQVEQMKARVATTKAEYDAAVAVIAEDRAELERAVATTGFRKKQYDRMKNLFELNSVDERLVDEKEEQLDAARASENACRAAIITAQAQAGAAKARTAQAEADLLDAQAKVQVAKATVAKARVFVEYTKIVSPYEGVITVRNFHVGDFVRAADQGEKNPLLRVARIDRMRVIVQLPEPDVPYCDPGDSAVVVMDALAGRKIAGKVSRIANSEDRMTRSMRVEIDLPNERNELRDGMFGRATIRLRYSGEGLVVPSSSIVGDPKTSKSALFVVRDEKAELVPVVVGQNNGVQAEILSGISKHDQIVRHPGANLSAGTLVVAEVSEPSAGAGEEVP